MRRIFIISGAVFLLFVLLVAIAGGKGKLPLYLSEFGLFLLILFATYLVGGEFLSRFFPELSFSAGELLLSAIGLGLLFFSFLGFLLGIFGLLFRPVLILLLVASVLYVLIKERGKVLVPFSQPLLPEKENLFFALVFLLMVIANLISAFSPVIFYDALVYHLGLPKEYLDAHRIFYLPYNMHGSLPQGGEMIYLFALILKSGVVGKLLNAFFGFFSALLLYFIGRKITSSDRGGFFPALLFYSLPQIFLLSTLVNVDLLSCFVLLLSLYFILRFLAGDKKALFLSALFSGFALSLKYQNVIGVITLVFFIFLLKREKSFRRWRAVMLFLGISALILSPWLVKNLILTGNPVYPFFYSLFGGKDWGKEEAYFFYQSLSGRIGGSFKFLPFLATFFALLSRWAQIGFHRFIIPIAVLLPFFLIKRERNLAIFGIFGVVELLFFSLLSGNVANLLRYALFAYALLFLSFGSFFARFRLKRLATVVLIIFATIDTGWGIAFRETLTSSYRVVFTSLPRRVYITQFVPSYPLMVKAGELARSGKILFIGETRAFYAPKGAIVPSANNGRYIVKLIEGGKGIPEIEKRLRSKGIRFILLDVPELARLRRVLGYLRFSSPNDEKLFLDYIRTRKAIARFRDIYLLES